jgi:mRNA interferase RelE/StbE
LTKSSYTVEWSSKIKKDLQALDKPIQRRIFAAVELLRINPRPSKARRLVANEPMLRVRVGDYRIIYQIEDERLVILVVRIAHRRDVYNDVN